MKAVETLSGVPAATLRAWERRYHAVEPARAGAGRRDYSMKEVERLRLLRQLVDRGHAIGGIARLSDAALRKLLVEAGGDPHRESGERLARQAAALGRRIEDSMTQLIDALDRFDLHALEEDLRAARVSNSVRAFLHRLVVPLMNEVGLRVERGTLRIAQEHALSSLVRNQLGTILQASSERSPRKGPALAFATAEGDLHEFGILMAALLASDQGFPTHLLGPNLPASDFALAAKNLRAEIVVLGTSPLEGADLKRPLEDYLRLLDEALPRNCALWMGGRGRCNISDLRLRRPLRQLGTLEAFDLALTELRTQSG